jgi:hypothetical protein
MKTQHGKVSNSDILVGTQVTNSRNVKSNSDILPSELLQICLYL